MKTVKVTIGSSGRATVEFVAFPGDVCSGERERLEKALLSLGVELQAVEVRRKPSDQIAVELTAASREQTKARLQHGHGT